MEETTYIGWVWLLITLATIFSLINIFLFVKLLKKFDINMEIVSQSIELISNQLTDNIKNVEILTKNYKILKNEIRENKSRVRQTKS
jgi:uncharacterized protein YoxC